MDPLKNFISVLTIAISNCSLYAKEHELIEESAKKVFSILTEFMTDQIELMIIDDDLVINKVPVRDARLHSNNFVRRLKKRGISRVDFLKGITAAELKQFIIDISKNANGAKNYPHIKTGVVAVICCTRFRRLVLRHLPLVSDWL